MNEIRKSFRSPMQPTAVALRFTADQVDWRGMFSWSLLFVANLILPLGFGSQFIKAHGRTGTMLATALIFIGGLCLCWWGPVVARNLRIGSVVTALSQIFFVLHVVLGLIALEVTDQFGLMLNAADGVGEANSQLGGFILTMIVGGSLLGCAGGIGAVFGLLMPSHSPGNHGMPPSSSK